MEAAIVLKRVMAPASPVGDNPWARAFEARGAERPRAWGRLKERMQGVFSEYLDELRREVEGG